MTSQKPIDLVQSFFIRLAGGDVDAALDGVDENIVYTNVSLPAVRGKRRFASLMRVLGGRIGFDVDLLAISGDDNGVVLTERIDELSVGRLHIRFWVCGRFEVTEGRITVWRDYFDYFDCTKAVLRGIAGVAVPSLNRSMNPMPRITAV
ncbi:limonene-1,2-epoxide hydrolase family protein [Gordonia zhaorongruii]|uniref:limonene-1,2-epoxide hydrolase family protein n=1 Tax=Gordonia zhaorongruii TaxID=2597659 RepID=UPI001042AD13|nr:limonene-1,2-epoxide hydrolase family protein [Gordonia zhaorongruii]